MPDEVKLKLTNVSKVYKGPKKRNTEALKNISLDISGPGMVFVVGESKSGKTTLLNLIGALEPTSGGMISVNGHLLDHMTSRAKQRYRVRDTGFMFQDCRLFPEMSVHANVALALRPYCRGQRKIHEMAQAVLSEFQLDSLSKLDLQELSKSQKRRLALARVLAIHKPIYLCDDPTFRLDEADSQMVMEALEKRSRNSLVVVTTTDLKLAETYGDRIIRLAEGSFVSDTHQAKPEKPAAIDSLVSVQPDRFVGWLHPIDFFRLVFGNLGRMLVFAFVMLVVMILSMMLVVNTTAIADYHSVVAYQRLLDHHDEYLVQMTQYLDQQYHLPGQTVFYRGPDPEENYSNDMKKISEKISYRVPIYPSYFFNRNFRDFLTVDQDGDSARLETYDQAMHFTDVIIVDDFLQFYQPLRYGSKPNAPTEVLIYDYMANELVNTGSIAGVSLMSDLIGTVLTDIDTGFTLTISGILKSDYSLYLSISETSPERQFASEYLAQRRSIIATPAFLTQLRNDPADSSILGLKVYLNENLLPEIDVRKMSFQEDMDDLAIIGNIGWNGSGDCLLISDWQLSEWLDVPLSDITSEYVDDLSMRIKIIRYDYDKSIDRSVLTEVESPVVVYEADQMDASTVKYLHESDESSLFANGDYRGMFLSLGANKSVNKKVISAIQWPKATDPFYDQFSNYIRAGFAEYTPYRLTILEIDQFQQDWVVRGKWWAAIALIVTLAGMVAGAMGSIRQNRHHIKILKSFGVASSVLVLIICLDLMIIFGLAFGVTYFLAPLPIEWLNELLENQYGYELVTFSMNSSYYWLGLGMTAIVGIACPLVAISFAMANVPLRTTSKKKV